MAAEATRVQQIEFTAKKLTSALARDFHMTSNFDLQPPNKLHLHLHFPRHSTTATMPKFFCDYCDVYLTHDSMSVRKAHNSGRNHLRNVVDYYQQIGHEKAQSVIDSITSSYAAEGQSGSNPMLAQNMGMPGAPGMMGVGPPGMPGVGPPGAGPPGGGALYTLREGFWDRESLCADSIHSDAADASRDDARHDATWYASHHCQTHTSNH